MTPNQVQFLCGIADNFMRKVLVGRKHVQKVPQWYGETVGFWNGNTLVAWTANVQGWTLSHSMFEFSNTMEAIEVVHAERRRQDDHRRRDVLRSRGVHAAAAHGDAVGPRRRHRRSGARASRSSSAACRARSSTAPTAAPTQLTPFDDGLHRLLRDGRGRRTGRRISSRAGSIRTSRALRRWRNRQSHALRRLRHRTSRVQAR